MHHLFFPRFSLPLPLLSFECFFCLPPPFLPPEALLKWRGLQFLSFAYPLNHMGLSFFPPPPLPPPPIEAFGPFFLVFFSRAETSDSPMGPGGFSRVLPTMTRVHSNPSRPSPFPFNPFLSSGTSSAVPVSKSDRRLRHIELHFLFLFSMRFGERPLFFAFPFFFCPLRLLFLLLHVVDAYFSPLFLNRSILSPASSTPF